MDSDKVLVVDAGEIMEFDHPFELIQKSDGFFKRLLDQTGSSTATALTLVAKEVKFFIAQEITKKNNFA